MNRYLGFFGLALLLAHPFSWSKTPSDIVKTRDQMSQIVIGDLLACGDVYGDSYHDLAQMVEAKFSDLMSVAGVEFKDPALRYKKISAMRDVAKIIEPADKWKNHCEEVVVSTAKKEIAWTDDAIKRLKSKRK